MEQKDALLDAQCITIIHAVHIYNSTFHFILNLSMCPRDKMDKMKKVLPSNRQKLLDDCIVKLNKF